MKETVRIAMITEVFPEDTEGKQLLETLREAKALGACLAILGINLKMQSVLVRGTFQGFKKYRLATLGVLDIDWVYNSMPPSHGQIYPEVPMEAVTNF